MNIIYSMHQKSFEIYIWSVKVSETFVVSDHVVGLIVWINPQCLSNMNIFRLCIIYGMLGDGFTVNKY